MLSVRRSCERVPLRRGDGAQRPGAGRPDGAPYDRNQRAPVLQAAAGGDVEQGGHEVDAEARRSGRRAPRHPDRVPRGVIRRRAAPDMLQFAAGDGRHGGRGEIDSGAGRPQLLAHGVVIAEGGVAEAQVAHREIADAEGEYLVEELLAAAELGVFARREVGEQAMRPQHERQRRPGPRAVRPARQAVLRLFRRRRQRRPRQVGREQRVQRERAGADNRRAGQRRAEPREADQWRRIDTCRQQGDGQDGLQGVGIAAAARRQPQRQHLRAGDGRARPVAGFDAAPVEPRVDNRLQTCEVRERRDFADPQRLGDDVGDGGVRPDRGRPGPRAPPPSTGAATESRVSAAALIPPLPESRFRRQSARSRRSARRRPPAAPARSSASSSSAPRLPRHCNSPHTGQRRSTSALISRG